MGSTGDGGSRTGGCSWCSVASLEERLRDSVLGNGETGEGPQTDYLGLIILLYVRNVEDFLLVLDSQPFHSICLLLYRSSKFVNFQAVLSAPVSTPEIPITCGLLQPWLPSECVRLLSPYFPSSSSVSE